MKKSPKQSFVRIAPRVRIRLRSYCRKHNLVMGTLVSEIVNAHLDITQTLAGRKGIETLLNCPTCNRKNFTVKGLRAHVCKVKNEDGL